MWARIRVQACVCVCVRVGDSNCGRRRSPWRRQEGSPRHLCGSCSVTQQWTSNSASDWSTRPGEIAGNGNSEWNERHIDSPTNYSMTTWNRSFPTSALIHLYLQSWPWQQENWKITQMGQKIEHVTYSKHSGEFYDLWLTIDKVWLSLIWVKYYQCTVPITLISLIDWSQSTTECSLVSCCYPQILSQQANITITGLRELKKKLKIGLRGLRKSLRFCLALNPQVFLTLCIKIHPSLLSCTTSDFVMNLSGPCIDSPKHLSLLLISHAGTSTTAKYRRSLVGSEFMLIKCIAQQWDNLYTAVWPLHELLCYAANLLSPVWHKGAHIELCLLCRVFSNYSVHFISILYMLFPSAWVSQNTHCVACSTAACTKDEGHKSGGRIFPFTKRGRPHQLAQPPCLCRSTFFTVPTPQGDQSQPWPPVRAQLLGVWGEWVGPSEAAVPPLPL